MEIFPTLHQHIGRKVHRVSEYKEESYKELFLNLKNNSSYKDDRFDVFEINSNVNMFTAKDIVKTDISFFWNTNESNLFIIIPFTGKDGTSMIIKKLLNTNFKSIIINSNLDSKFNKIIETIIDLYEDPLFIEIRGIKDEIGNLIISNGVNFPFNSKKSGAAIMAKHIPEYFNLFQCQTFLTSSGLDGEAFSRPFTSPLGPKPVFSTMKEPIIISNSQVINKVKDTGRFIYIGLSSKFRDTQYEYNCDRIINIINKTLETWNNDAYKEEKDTSSPIQIDSSYILDFEEDTNEGMGIKISIEPIYETTFKLSKGLKELHEDEVIKNRIKKLIISALEDIIDELKHS